MVNLIRTHTTGQAGTQVRFLLSTQETVTYEDLINHLRDKFQPFDSAEELISKFYTIKNERGESAEKFAERLQEVARKIIIIDKSWIQPTTPGSKETKMDHYLKTQFERNVFSSVHKLTAQIIKKETENQPFVTFLTKFVKAQTTENSHHTRIKTTEHHKIKQTKQTRQAKQTNRS